MLQECNKTKLASPTFASYEIYETQCITLYTEEEAPPTYIYTPPERSISIMKIAANNEHTTGFKNKKKEYYIIKVIDIIFINYEATILSNS
jgi:hypothetical protein